MDHSAEMKSSQPPLAEHSLATARETQGQRSPTEMRDLNTSNIRNCHSLLLYIYSNGWLVSAWYAIHESQEGMRNKRYWEKKGKGPSEADRWTHSLKRLSKFPPTNHATISLFLKTLFENTDCIYTHTHTHTMDWASFLNVKLIWEWIKSALFLMASRGQLPITKARLNEVKKTILHLILWPQQIISLWVWSTLGKEEYGDAP